MTAVREIGAGIRVEAAAVSGKARKSCCDRDYRQTVVAVQRQRGFHRDNQSSTD